MKKVRDFFQYFSFRCDPWLACSRHGRCWTHSHECEGHPCSICENDERDVRYDDSCNISMSDD